MTETWKQLDFLTAQLARNRSESAATIIVKPARKHSFSELHETIDSMELYRIGDL